jgi:hypothetical protein
MRVRYGKGTHAACKECGRKIFITEAELTARDGKRWVLLACKLPGCVAYEQPRLYDEGALEIHGTTERATTA